MTTGEVLLWGFVWLTFLWPLGFGLLAFLGWSIFTASPSVYFTFPFGLVLTAIGLLLWWLPIAHGLRRCATPYRANSAGWGAVPAEQHNDYPGEAPLSEQELEKLKRSIPPNP